MVTKKIRTEYMKKFRDPKWETFSKCYEDSLKYRLTRRVMEHSHKPWFWEGWEGGSASSGWSTPRLSTNRVAPLPLPPPLTPEADPGASGPEPPPEDQEPEEAAVVGRGQDAENGMTEDGGAETAAVPENAAERDNGPAEAGSSDGELVNPPARPRHRRRAPRSDTGRRNSSVSKPPRAKSQPAISSKETPRTSRQEENTSDACVQTHGGSSRRSSNLERRRARSADLEKVQQSQLMTAAAAADDRWTTEYMRCFSARLR